jgi:hypothetical protein
MDHFFKNSPVKNYLILLLLLLFAIPALAQDSSKVKKKWSFLTEAYMMFPNMKGTMGAGTLPDASLDVNAGEIFSHFQIGAMFYFETVHDRWSFNTDIIYMHLKQDIDSGRIIKSGEVNVKQFAWEAAALYKLLPWLEAGIGARLNSLDTKVDLITKDGIGGATQARNKSITQTWVDPILIARIKSDPSKKFIYQFRGDIGGFGIGSDLAWQIQAYAGYRFSKLFQLTGGYRVISADYNKGSGEERFLYDVNTFGPVVRLGFNF